MSQTINIDMTVKESQNAVIFLINWLCNIGLTHTAAAGLFYQSMTPQSRLQTVKSISHFYMNKHTMPEHLIERAVAEFEDHGNKSYDSFKEMEGLTNVSDLLGI